MICAASAAAGQVRGFSLLDFGFVELVLKRKIFAGFKDVAVVSDAVETELRDGGGSPRSNDCAAFRNETRAPFAERVTGAEPAEGTAGSSD